MIADEQRLSDDVVAIPEEGPQVLHIFACWEFDRRPPGVGDRAACGWIMPTTSITSRPFKGNEHRACVVCLDIVRQNQMGRVRGFFWKLRRGCLR